MNIVIKDGAKEYLRMMRKDTMTIYLEAVSSC